MITTLSPFPKSLDEMIIKKTNEFIENNMPLIKSSSDKARSKNIAAEIKAGKNPKVAAAIGYSVQREAKKKKK